jgi:hypothetical protein
MWEALIIRSNENELSHRSESEATLQLKSLFRHRAVGFIDWLDLVAMQYMQNHDHDHGYDGDDERKHTEPASERVWRPRGRPWNVADARTKANLTVNSKSQRNSRCQRGRDGDHREAESDRQRCTDKQQ